MNFILVISVRSYLAQICNCSFLFIALLLQVEVTITVGFDIFCNSVNFCSLRHFPEQLQVTNGYSLVHCARMILIFHEIFFHFRTTVEQLQNEVQALDNRIQKIKKQVEMPTIETEIKNQMREFLKVCIKA